MGTHHRSSLNCQALAIEQSSSGDEYAGSPYRSGKCLWSRGVLTAFRLELPVPIPLLDLIEHRAGAVDGLFQRSMGLGGG